MIAFSNTRLTTFKRCRLKYYWQYVDKQPQQESVALRRGKAAHAALAEYYKGMSIKDAVRVAWYEYDPFTDESLQKMDELDGLLTRYLNWSKIHDRWRVLEVEKTIEVKYKSVKLMGIWDLLVDYGGKLLIVDHKFQKSHSFANLEVDPQVTHYLALAKLAGYDVHGLMYNIVNLETGNTENVCFRQIVGRQDYFIRSYLEGLEQQTKEIKKLEKGKLPVYPNWTRDCCWDCSFYRRCVDSPFQKEKS